MDFRPEISPNHDCGYSFCAFPRNSKSDLFHWVKIVQKIWYSTYCDQNLISSILVRIHQYAKFQATQSMFSRKYPARAPKFDHFHILVTRTTFEMLKHPRQPRDQYAAQIVNTLELRVLPHQIKVKKKKKIPLQPCNQPSEVSSNKYICGSKKWSQCETVALWNSLVTWKLAQYLSYVTGSPTVNRGLSLVAAGFIDHQYSWFGRIPSAVANRYRKSAPLWKRSVDNIDFLTY